MLILEDNTTMVLMYTIYNEHMRTVNQYWLTFSVLLNCYTSEYMTVTDA